MIRWAPRSASSAPVGGVTYPLLLLLLLPLLLLLLLLRTTIEYNN